MKLPHITSKRRVADFVRRARAFVAVAPYDDAWLSLYFTADVLTELLDAIEKECGLSAAHNEQEEAAQ